MQYACSLVFKKWASQMALVVKNPAGGVKGMGSIPGWRAPEEGTATHSSILAWRIPWTEEPGGLLSIGLQRVGHDSSNLACMHTVLKNTELPWRRKWQPTQVFVPGKSHGQRRLVSYSPRHPKRVGHDLATNTNNVKYFFFNVWWFFKI